MKELTRFRQFLNENLDEISLRGLMNRDMTGEEIIEDPAKFEKLVNKVKRALKMPLSRPEEISLRNHLEAEMKEFPDTDFSLPEEFKMLVKNALYNLGYEDDDLPNMPPLEEGAFGDKAKVALENRLTGMAKAMVEDGDLFAEGGNVTYDEKDLKDGATPEQIEAIDQIKAAVIEMGGRVNYGVSDEDGTLTYMYIVVDEPPTYDAVLKVITKENNEPNLFRSVFKEEEGSISEREVTVTDEHKAEMLKVAQDLRNLVKTHVGGEGTRLLNGKMQQRDALIKAANTLENLAR